MHYKSIQFNYSILNIVAKVCLSSWCTSNTEGFRSVTKFIADIMYLYTKVPIEGRVFQCKRNFVECNMRSVLYKALMKSKRISVLHFSISITKNYSVNDKSAVKLSTKRNWILKKANMFLLHKFQ